MFEKLVRRKMCSSKLIIFDKKNRKKNRQKAIEKKMFGKKLLVKNY